MSFYLPKIDHLPFGIPRKTPRDVAEFGAFLGFGAQGSFHQARACSALPKHAALRAFVLSCWSIYNGIAAIFD